MPYFYLKNRGITRAKETDFQAIREAIQEGIDFSMDYHAQSNAGEVMSRLAKKYNYRKPKNANGSTGRYYFYRLARLLEVKAHQTLRIKGA